MVVKMVRAAGFEPACFSAGDFLTTSAFAAKRVSRVFVVWSTPATWNLFKSILTMYLTLVKYMIGVSSLGMKTSNRFHQFFSRLPSALYTFQ